MLGDDELEAVEARLHKAQRDIEIDLVKRIGAVQVILTNNDVVHHDPKNRTLGEERDGVGELQPEAVGLRFEAGTLRHEDRVSAARISKHNWCLGRDQTTQREAQSLSFVAESLGGGCRIRERHGEARGGRNGRRGRDNGHSGLRVERSGRDDDGCQNRGDVVGCVLAHGFYRWFK